MKTIETQFSARKVAPIRLRGFFGDPRLLQLVSWCLPVLIVGALLRIAITVDMPYGYTQYDSADFLATPRVFITEHRLHINPKRSFVTPVLFSLPFLLPVPALITIPIAQHLLGLVAILIVGAIVRLWFKHWKWFVIPVTLLVGANPMIIWYEHTLLGEFQYLFFELLAALAGSIWVKRPSRLTFGFFLASLILVTGTRLEGKLFFLVALVLIPIVLWGRWRSLLIHAALTLGLMVFGFAASGGRDGSPLLLATMIHLAPDHFKSNPGLEPYLIPLRDELRIRFPEYPGSLVKTSKRVEDQADRYFDETWKGKLSQGEMEAKRAKVMRDLCVEIFKARPLDVLKLPLVKFRLAVDAWSAYCWDDHYLHTRQVEALNQKPWMAPVLSKGLTGRTRTLEEIGEWVNAHFDEKRVQWFTNYQKLWNDAGLYFRTSDRPATQTRSVHDFFGGVAGELNTMPGIPFFYMAGLAGMLAASLRWRNLGCFHLIWAGCMLAIMYAALMVGVTNGRFRFAYEPFFLIYSLLLLDCLVTLLQVGVSQLRMLFPPPLNEDGK